MSAQSYAIDFDGYWREPNKGSIPAKSAFTVFIAACTTHRQKQLH